MNFKRRNLLVKRGPTFGQDERERERTGENAPLMEPIGELLSLAAGRTSHWEKSSASFLRVCCQSLVKRPLSARGAGRYYGPRKSRETRVRFTQRSINRVGRALSTGLGRRTSVRHWGSVRENQQLQQLHDPLA